MSPATTSIPTPATLLRRPSLIDEVDPRSRVLAALAFSLLTAVCHQFAAMGLALGIAALAMLLARLHLRQVARRLAPLNLLLLVLVAVLPWTTLGTPLIEAGSLRYSQEGLLLVAAIALKGNAIVLGLMVLIGTLDITTLGHALSHLRVPEKLIHLLLFTVRYLEVLQREYLRLTGAMRVRGFRPGLNRHTYRTYGYLVGMLLVRSVERSHRVVAAMKCRGFRGRFYLLDHFVFSLHDALFGMVSLILLLGIALLEWR